MSAREPITVLHYVGYDVDRGGILTVVRTLASEERFQCLLGVNPGFVATLSAGMACERFPALAGDRISVVNAWRARRVADHAQAWLRADGSRIFHGHSRAGLLAAGWLRARGERRVIATVHCYGRQRWFYRGAARRMRGHIAWLTPAMKSYYGLGDVTWTDCLPGAVRLAEWARTREPRASRVVTFGGAGALVPVKQWELVVQALRQIAPDAPLRYVHAGDVDGSPESARYAAALRAHAADLGGRWAWRGQVRDMPAFFAEIDCLVVASRAEGFSVAALEAAAAGVPVLAADAAGNTDLVHAARLGWTFRPDAPEALAAEMRRLVESGELARWRRDDAAFQRFTAAASAEAHLSWYRRLIDDER